MRVESSHTRQALLEVGTALDPFVVPDKLQLFTEDGLAVDLGKDRTRARWRGVWSATPVDGAYETNDFVLDDDKLWLLSDAELNEDDVHPTDSTTGAWTLLTISGGMRWAGVYDSDVDYRPNDVVTYDDKLWIAPTSIEAGTTPGTAGGAPSTGTTKAGDAMFGGHNQPCYIATKGHLIDPVPPQIGGEVNIGQPIGSKFIRVNAVVGEEVTIEWTGGDLTLFDGGGGDALFPASPSPPGSDIHVASSPLTFTVPSLSASHGDVPAHVCIEVDPDVDTFIWVDPDHIVPPVWEMILDYGGSGGGGGGGTNEGWHTVGGSGEPAFENGWGPGSPGLLKFRKRSDGMVELRGFVVVGSGSSMVTVFTLPVGYRITSTEEQMWFTVWGPSGPLKAEVWHDGKVKVTQALYASLDSIQFSVD